MDTDFTILLQSTDLVTCWIGHHNGDLLKQGATDEFYGPAKTLDFLQRVLLPLIEQFREVVWNRWYACTFFPGHAIYSLSL